MQRIPFKLLTLLVWLGSISAVAQYEDKNLTALRIETPPKIDGVLDESFWILAEPATGFTQEKPNPGATMPQNSEVRIAYDHEAIFIGFTCFDTAPDSILKQLSGRDQSGNTDYCGIIFGCYRDGVNGFAFNVTPNGEQYDVRIDNNGEDLAWNAVWYCKTSIGEKGWVAEFKIPFAALRFPDVPVQYWNINFVREIRRNRNRGHWRGINPLVPGFLTQMGTLSGINNIETPRRIFFSPYTSAYYNTRENEDGSVDAGFSYNAGLDLKLGLSDAFTMDMTLIPDFGQTISDQQILNLSAFEVQFTDNRQFFTEGTELFSKGGLFYSRRIGFELPLRYRDAAAAVNDHEVLEENPTKDQVINAFKISGRDKNRLGVGVFNAVTAPSEALIRDTLTGALREVNTSSLTNYSVFVLDQILPNNSYVSLINTNVLRSGTDFDVNVTGTSFDIRDKRNNWGISGSGALNTKYGREFAGPDVKDDNGFRQEISLNKLSGNYTFKIGQFSKSNTYDPTDLGFLAANNAIGYYFQNSYNIYKPFGRFNNFSTTLNINYNRLYEPNTFTGVFITSRPVITTRKFNTYGVNLDWSPVRGYDYFEPRVWGRYFRTYKNYLLGGWYSSDYRKVIAIDVGTWWTNYENPGRYIFNWRVAPRIRVNDHLFITYVYSYQSHINDLGYAFKFEDEERTKPLFGRRDVISHTNVLNVKYAFNPVMTLNTRVRHYWGYTRFHEYYTLLEDGYLAPSDVTSVNQSFNAFTVDLVYTWIFTPGSELSFVWKNEINDLDTDIPSSLGDDLDYTFGRPQTNSYSLKLIYFLDYHTVADLIHRKRPES
jgi:hypothetical protein